MYGDRRVPFRDQDVKKIEQKNVLHSYLCEGFRGLPWISEVCCNKNENLGYASQIMLPILI